MAVLALPGLQALLLTRVGLSGRRWLMVNVAAWGLGISWTLLPSPVVDATTSPLAIAVIYAVAGVAMAATVAVVTGLELRHQLARPLLVREGRRSLAVGPMRPSG